MKSISISLLKIVLLQLICFGVALAQQQTISLAPGFTPDPYIIQGTSNGQDNAPDYFPGDRYGNPCSGFINYRQPNVMLTVTRGGLSTVINVQSTGDSTLIIRNLENNQLYCNDDYKGQRSATIDDYFPAGQYAVYVGTIGSPFTFSLSFIEKGHAATVIPPTVITHPGNQDTDPNPNIVASRIFCYYNGNNTCGYFAVFDPARDLTEISITLPNGELSVIQFDFVRHSFYVVGNNNLTVQYDGRNTYYMDVGAASFTVPQTLIPGY